MHQENGVNLNPNSEPNRETSPENRERLEIAFSEFLADVYESDPAFRVWADAEYDDKAPSRDAAA